jgi:Flp pilus assembly protein TadG
MIAGAKRRSSVWLKAARQDRAATAVEFALILPILLTMLFAILQFGLTLNNDIQLTDAIREGARAFSSGRALGTPVTSADAIITSNAPSLMPIANVSPKFAVSGTACTSDAACTALMTTAGLSATVTGTYSCNLTVMGVNFAKNCTLSASTTDLLE